MERTAPVIRAIDVRGLDAFVAYLEDHVKDNGRNGVPLFQPQSRGAAWLASEKIELFRTALATDVGTPNWRRAWGAFDAGGAITGHVDLRAHTEPCSLHRALLGMGVHRDHRRRGLGRALIEHAISWALRETDLEWIDLSFLGGNTPAQRLYQSAGFQDLGTIPDMFRIDGASIPDVMMTKRIRPESKKKALFSIDADAEDQGQGQGDKGGHTFR